MWKKRFDNRCMKLYFIVFRNSAELAEEDMQILSFSIQLHRNRIALIFCTCWKRKSKQCILHSFVLNSVCLIYAETALLLPSEGKITIHIVLQALQCSTYSSVELGRSTPS